MQLTLLVRFEIQYPINASFMGELKLTKCNMIANIRGGDCFEPGHEICMAFGVELFKGLSLRLHNVGRHHLTQWRTLDFLPHQFLHDVHGLSTLSLGYRVIVHTQMHTCPLDILHILNNVEHYVSTETDTFRHGQTMLPSKGQFFCKSPDPLREGFLVIPTHNVISGKFWDFK